MIMKPTTIKDPVDNRLLFIGWIIGTIFTVIVIFLLVKFLNQFNPWIYLLGVIIWAFSSAFIVVVLHEVLLGVELWNR
jgi:hypothetical protein